jgi:hypothetical protein
LWVDNKVDAKTLSWLLVTYDPFKPEPTGGIKKFKYLSTIIMLKKVSLLRLKSKKEGIEIKDAFTQPR